MTDTMDDPLLPPMRRAFWFPELGVWRVLLAVIVRTLQNEWCLLVRRAIGAAIVLIPLSIAFGYSGLMDKPVLDGFLLLEFGWFLLVVFWLLQLAFLIARFLYLSFKWGDHLTATAIEPTQEVRFRFAVNRNVPGSSILRGFAEVFERCRIQTEEKDLEALILIGRKSANFLGMTCAVRLHAQADGILELGVAISNAPLNLPNFVLFRIDPDPTVDFGLYCWEYLHEVVTTLQEQWMLENVEDESL